MHAASNPGISAIRHRVDRPLRGRFVDTMHFLTLHVHGHNVVRPHIHIWHAASRNQHIVSSRDACAEVPLGMHDHPHCLGLAGYLYNIPA